MARKSPAGGEAKDGAESNSGNRKRPRANPQSPSPSTLGLVIGNPHERANKNGGKGNRSGVMEPCINESGSLSLTESDVLDCSICYELLTIPVYQCENGHVACSSCCTKVLKKCPTCCSSIGHNRNRAIEKVIESLEVKCQNREYGCTITMSYSKMIEHQKKCSDEPCSCPLPDCNFVHNYIWLYLHFRDTHPNSSVKFKYGSVFQVLLNVSDKFLVLQEENDDLFILSNGIAPLGRVVFLSVVSTHVFRGCFYDVMARSEKGRLRFQSYTKVIQKMDEKSTSTEFLLVPSDFTGSNTQLKLDICILDRFVSPPSFDIST